MSKKKRFPDAKVVQKFQKIFVCGHVGTNKNTSLQIYQSQVNVLGEFLSSKNKVFKEINTLGQL